MFDLKYCLDPALAGVVSVWFSFSLASRNAKQNDPRLWNSTKETAHIFLASMMGSFLWSIATPKLLSKVWRKIFKIVVIMCPPFGGNYNSRHEFFPTFPLAKKNTQRLWGSNCLGDGIRLNYSVTVTGVVMNPDLSQKYRLIYARFSRANNQVSEAPCFRNATLQTANILLTIRIILTTIQQTVSRTTWATTKYAVFLVLDLHNIQIITRVWVMLRRVFSGSGGHKPDSSAWLRSSASNGKQPLHNGSYHHQNGWT